MITPPPTPTEPHRSTTFWTPRAAPRRYSAMTAEVRLVGERDRDGRPHREGQALAERFVAPAEVRGHGDEPVASADDADDGHADADEHVPGRQPIAEGRGQFGQAGRDVVHARSAARDVHANRVEHLAAKADGGRRQ